LLPDAVHQPASISVRHVGDPRYEIEIILKSLGYLLGNIQPWVGE
jgi:hypothetical protein